MDLSQVKSVLGRLTFIKNYAAYIPAVAIFLVAAGLIMGSSFLSGRLKGRIKNGSLRLAGDIQTLASQDISSNQWQVEKQYQDALQADANSMAGLAKRSMQRELLSYRIFPEPKDTSILIFEQFGQSYRSGIEQMISNYSARQCPSQAEIDKALQKVSADSSGTASRGGDYGRYGRTGTDGGISLGGLDKVQRMIVDELCRAAAENASFYAGPFDIAGYEFWDKPQPTDTVRSQSSVYQYQSIEQSVSLCWYWQLGYWIIEDVFQTIASMNNRCDSVLDCPVKRLMEVSFGPGSKGRTGDAGLSVPPGYVTLPGSGLTSGHTARVSLQRYDIVQFRISVLLDARAVLGFMDELCGAKEHKFGGWFGDEPAETFRHNQITVLEADMNPVIVTQDQPSQTNEHQLYRYGADPVVRLQMVCEYVFEKEGYQQAKPEFLKGTQQDSGG